MLDRASSSRGVARDSAANLLIRHSLQELFMTRVAPSRHRSSALAAVVITFLGLTACAQAADSASPPPTAPPAAARNVIFINGDGMAAAQREAGRLSISGLDGDLEMNKLPTAGTLTTDSHDPATFVTDSAAAATAWATGQKTYNGAISVDVNKNALQVLGTQAKASGRATGLVTTAQVTDASRPPSSRERPTAAARTRSLASTSTRASPT